MPTSGFSSNGNYQIDVDAALQSQNRAGNYSIIYWRIIVRKLNGYGHMATTNMGNKGSADSVSGQVWRDDNMAYDFRNGSEYMIADGTFRVNHNGSGEASYYFSAALTYYALGSASASTGWRNLPRLASEPEAPYPVAFHRIDQVAIEYQFAGRSDGGLPIREWQIGYGRNPSYPEYFVGSNGTTLVGGLTPATTWYFWSRGRNDIGWSGWSARSEARTHAGARIKIDGQWREAVPYIKYDGQWRLVEPLIKIDGRWRATP